MININYKAFKNQKKLQKLLLKYLKLILILILKNSIIFFKLIKKPFYNLIETIKF